MSETTLAGPRLNPEEVRMAYRLILGREPESEAVVAWHCDNVKTLAALSAAFLASDEFRGRNGAAPAAFAETTARGYAARQLAIETQVTPAVLDRLAQRIRTQWTTLGEEDPHWSVLTEERFRARRLDAAAEADFRRSGKNSADLIDLFAQRSGRAPPTGVCVELGCGVGRITRWLAKRFARVIAVDISPGNLALCEKYMKEEGVTNVETRLIASIDELEHLPKFDMFYSLIVLQHNPPPIQYRMLATLFPKIAPGGGCLFQTVADLPGYAFKAESYLGSPSPQMEIHSLPMAEILTLLRTNGLILDLVRSDVWVAAYGSYTFAAHRDG